jgi:hypothetical protein
LNIEKRGEAMMNHSVSVASLIVILKGLCEQGSPTRRALEADPFTAPHLPLLEAQLGQLVSASSSGADQRVAALGVELGGLDDHNDRDVGGLIGTLRGAIALLEDDEPALAGELGQALEVMVGSGLVQLTGARYDAIGGYAAQRDQRMSPAMRAAMQKVRFGKKTLLESFERWVTRAAELSAKELERVALAAKHKTNPGTTSADLVRLKRDTIHRLNKLIAAIDDSALSHDLQRAILAPIEKAAADARA